MENNFTFLMTPVDNEVRPLVGRSNLVQNIINDILNNYVNISIIGDTKIGKSSMINTIKLKLKKEDNLCKTIPVYLDFARFSKEITGDEILSKILRNIYQTNDVLKQQYSEANINKYDEFSDVVDTCMYLNMRIILLFDNLDSLTFMLNLDCHFWTYLRGIASDKSLSIITASRRGLETLCHKGRIAGSQF